MKVERQPHGVSIILSEEAFDENLPGEINLTWDEADKLYWELANILRRKERDEL